MADAPASSGVRDALRALRAGTRIVALALPDEREAVVADIATIVDAVTGGLRQAHQRRDLIDALAGVAAEMDAEDRRWPTPGSEEDADEGPEVLSADRARIERARARVDEALGSDDG